MAGSTPASAIAEPGRDDPTARVGAPGEESGPSGGTDPAWKADLAAPLGKAVVGVSPWREAWRRFKRHRLAFWSLWILALMVLAVLIGPLFYKVGVNAIDFKARLAPPSALHPFGTDDLGRDLLARMLYGGRISLAVGLAAMLMAITVGVIGVPSPAWRAAGSMPY